MHGFFLLYALTYVPISGAYSEPIKTAREAAFIQSGVKAEWDVIKRAAEKKVPPAVSSAAFVYSLAKKKELHFKTRQFGTWAATPKTVSVTWEIKW